MKNWILGLLIAALAGGAHAEGADPLARIAEQQRVLASDLTAGVLTVTPEAATAIRDEQAKVFDLLGRHGSLDSMRTEDRVALDGSLQRINAALVGTTEADANQRQCRLERTTGSQMRKVTCRSKGEWRRLADEARAYKSRYFICVPPGCGENPADSALRPNGAPRN